MEIRCPECDKLLAIKKKDAFYIHFEVKSKHDRIDVAFPFGKVNCKCGKVFCLNPYTPYIYSLPLDEAERTIYDRNE